MCWEPQWQCKGALDRVHLFPHPTIPTIHQYLLIGCKENIFTGLTYRENTRHQSSNTLKTDPVHQVPFPHLIIFQHPNIHRSIRNLNHWQTPIIIQQINPISRPITHFIWQLDLLPNLTIQVKCKHTRTTRCQPMKWTIQKHNLVLIHMCKLLILQGHKFSPFVRLRIKYQTYKHLLRPLTETSVITR